jgi:hypothetical protein
MQTQQEQPKLTLTQEHVALLGKRLGQLHADAGAQCAFLSDRDGNILSRVGMTVGFDLDVLALFVGKWFGAAAEIGWYLGDSSAFDLNYHDGAWYDLYAANIGNYLFLTLIFTKSAQTGKIGMVWVLTRRAVGDLLKLVESGARAAAAPKPAAVPEQKPLSAPQPAPQVRVTAEVPAPVPPPLDELDLDLMRAAEESRTEGFSGVTYEQAKAMGLLGALEDK